MYRLGQERNGLYDWGGWWDGQLAGPEKKNRKKEKKRVIFNRRASLSSMVSLSAIPNPHPGISKRVISIGQSI